MITWSKKLPVNIIKSDHYRSFQDVIESVVQDKLINGKIICKCSADLAVIPIFFDNWEINQKPEIDVEYKYGTANNIEYRLLAMLPRGTVLITCNDELIECIKVVAI